MQGMSFTTTLQKMHVLRAVLPEMGVTAGAPADWPLPVFQLGRPPAAADALAARRSPGAPNAADAALRELLQLPRYSRSGLEALLFSRTPYKRYTTIYQDVALSQHTLEIAKYIFKI